MIQPMKKALSREDGESYECERLALSVTDPTPIDDTRYGKVGFEAFCTKVKYRNLRIKKLEYVDDWKTYTPEFLFFVA